MQGLIAELLDLGWIMVIGADVVNDFQQVVI